jgi:neurofibromin 1
VEIVADSAVTSASSNALLLSLTPTLEQQSIWNDIDILLLRSLRMFSFINPLDVASHLSFVFHLVTLQVSRGPLTLRASTHGSVRPISG